MATITSNGPSPIPKLNEAVNLLRDIKFALNDQPDKEAAEALLKAVKEITSR